MSLAISGTHPNIFEHFSNSDAGEGDLYTLMYLEHCFAFLQAAHTRTFHSCPSPAWASILLAISGTPGIHTIRSLERSSFRVRCLLWNIHSMPDFPQNPALHVSTLLLTFVPSMPDLYHGEMQRPQMFQNISAAFIRKPLIFVISLMNPKLSGCVCTEKDRRPGSLGRHVTILHWCATLLRCYSGRLWLVLTPLTASYTPLASRALRMLRLCRSSGHLFRYAEMRMKEMKGKD
jgi:hypothetical protein